MTSLPALPPEHAGRPPAARECRARWCPPARPAPKWRAACNRCSVVGSLPNATAAHRNQRDAAPPMVAALLDGPQQGQLSLPATHAAHGLPSHPSSRSWWSEARPPGHLACTLARAEAGPGAGPGPEASGEAGSPGVGGQDVSLAAYEKTAFAGACQDALSGHTGLLVCTAELLPLSPAVRVGCAHLSFSPVPAYKPRVPAHWEGPCRGNCTQNQSRTQSRVPATLRAQGDGAVSWRQGAWAAREGRSPAAHAQLS